MGSRFEMKIKIKDIVKPWYEPREELDENYVNELAESIKNDGLWNPIMVREINGKFELIAGKNRMEAVKKLGIDSIDAKIVDIDEEIASVLAIKTNFLQKNLTEIEEAKAIKKIIDKFGFNQTEIAEKLGKSPTWVANRLSLVMKLSKKVRDALSTEDISPTHAVSFSSLKEKDQDILLEYCIQNKWGVKELKEGIRKFQNDTLFSIGYEGLDLDGLIASLKDNNIDILIDIRDSVKSTRKPEFNGEIIERECKKNDIEYINKPELGVIYQIRRPYIEGYINHEAFRGWYDWHLDEQVFDFEEFKTFLKSSGKCCFLCMEKFPKPNKKQKHFCHRDLLIEKILNHNSENQLENFTKRQDL